MSRTLWCNPALGVAGDMLLGALLDLGADQGFVLAQLETLPVDGWSLTVTQTTRRGLVATSVQVDAPDDDHHRPWSRIDRMLAEAPLDPYVADGARRTFRRLGEAEAAVHGIGIDEVHFHEVGAVDAIVDIVGTWAALSSLDVTEVRSGPVGLGHGTTGMSHGVVPVPAPATLELLVGVPTVAVDWQAETATPTGVALLVSMVEDWGGSPGGRVAATGRGAGSRDPQSHPNVVTVVAFDGEPSVSTDAATSEAIGAVVIETNLDDVTPEVIGHVIDRALALGADDAWASAITMKKSRPGHQLHVLCRPELAAALRELVAEETGTLGLRERRVDKYELGRRIDHVVVDGQRIRIKVGPHGAKPEHDDVVAASAALGRPLRRVSAEALGLWRDARG